MNQYKVRSGENIFDVALTLYGSIEGVFDLLISNPDGIDNGPLTINTKLKPGMILNYHTEYRINQDIVKWVEDEKIRILNGDHVYYFSDVDELVTEHVQNFNQDLIDKACQQWPNVYANGQIIENYDIDNARYFFRYINAFYIGSCSTDLELLARKSVYEEEHGSANDFNPPSIDEVNIYLEKLCQPRIIVKQSGVLSAISARVKPKSIMVIDWGDATPPEIHTYTQEPFVSEHNYDGNGLHKITIYGNFSLYELDFTGVSGLYYALSPIDISGDFKNNFDKDNILNSLFSSNTEEE